MEGGTMQWLKVKQWWTKRTDIKIVTDEVIGEALTA
jgi:hypothetical protein